ncbi:hypothetical protein BJX96DRAFT_15057 [Aspergillus floccosus]
MPSHSPSCAFCNIAATYPPLPPSRFLPADRTGETALPPSSDPSDIHAFLVLSTKYVLAFLDIMPLTRGHVLVVTRDHYEKLGDMDVRASREVSLALVLQHGRHEERFSKYCFDFQLICADRPVAPHHLPGRHANSVRRRGGFELALERRAEQWYSSLCVIS